MGDWWRRERSLRIHKLVPGKKNVRLPADSAIKKKGRRCGSKSPT